MTWYILNIALACFDAYTILSVFNRIFPRRAATRWLAVLAVVCVAFNISTQLLDVDTTLTIVLTAVVCVGLTLPFQAKWKQRLFYAVIMIALGITAEIIAGYVVSIATGKTVAELTSQAHTMGTEYLIATTMAKLIFFLLARLVCRIKVMKDRSLSRSHWIIVMLVPLTSIAIQYGLGIASTQLSLTDYTAPFLVLLGMLAINALAFSVYDVMSNQSEELINLERAKSRMAYEIRYYETIAAQSKRLSAQAHDIHSHMVALQGLLAEKKTAEAEQYIHEIAMPEYVNQPALVPGHPAISAVLGDRIARAEKAGN